MFCVAEQSTWTPSDPPRRDADARRDAVADVETDQATSSPSAKLAGFGSLGLKLFYGGRKHPRSAAGQKRKLDIVSDVGRSARARKVPTRYLQ